MSVTFHGAHLAGASALATSLQLGAASAASLDPAIGVIDGSESSYAPAKAPLFFSEDGSGGGNSSMTMPGPLAQSIDRPQTDTPTLDSDADRPAVSKLEGTEEAKAIIGLVEGDNLTAIDRKLSQFTSSIRHTFEVREGQDNVMERLVAYHRAFDALDPLLDYEDSNIVHSAIQYISKDLMSSDLADAIYPGSQMTYRGRFLKRASDAWNLGGDPSARKVTPMVKLVRSLGTDRNAIPESPILRLDKIVVSENAADFEALIKAISDESTSHDVDRSKSAAFAFVLSARLIEDPSRLEELTNTFLDQVEWASSRFRDAANYWIPMGAISDTGNLIDEPAMYTKFIETIAAKYIDLIDLVGPPIAVPAIFQLAAHLQHEERIEELVALVQKDYKSYNVMEAFRYLKVPNYILSYEWKFTTAELAILTKAAEVLKIEPWAG